MKEEILRCTQCKKPYAISAFRKRDLEEQVCKKCRPPSKKYFKHSDKSNKPVSKKWLERGL